MAMIRLRDGRELEVVETVAEMTGATAGTEGELAKKLQAMVAAKQIESDEADKHKCKKVGDLVVVHEVRRTLKRKFPTPVDTKAEFVYQILDHAINLAQVMDIVDEQVVNPVHHSVHADMQAVSGPFKHDFDQHVVECVEVDGRKVDKLHDVDCTKCADLAADEAAVKAADQHGVKTADKGDDTQK